MYEYKYWCILAEQKVCIHSYNINFMTEALLEKTAVAQPLMTASGGIGRGLNFSP
jgi:hypothetical protein